MKKRFAAAALMAVLSTSAFAEEGGFKPGDAPPPPHKQDAGYKGSEDTNQSTVESIRDVRPDAWTTLEGNLIKDKGNDHYDFRDKTGTIAVVIPKGVFREKTFEATDLVRLSGKVKGKGKDTVLHVERVDEP